MHICDGETSGSYAASKLSHGRGDDVAVIVTDFDCQVLFVGREVCSRESQQSSSEDRARAWADAVNE